MELVGKRKRRTSFCRIQELHNSMKDNFRKYLGSEKFSQYFLESLISKLNHNPPGEK